MRLSALLSLLDVVDDDAVEGLAKTYLAPGTDGETSSDELVREVEMTSTTCSVDGVEAMALNVRASEAAPADVLMRRWADVLIGVAQNSLGLDKLQLARVDSLRGDGTASLSGESSQAHQSRVSPMDENCFKASVRSWF